MILLTVLSKIKKLTLIKLREINNFKIRRRLSQKKVIDVVFMNRHSNNWKYEHLYKRFEESENFKPLVFIVPRTNYPEKIMLNGIKEAYDFFQEKGYRVVKAKRNINGEWEKIENMVPVDILFFANHHENTVSQYKIKNIKNILGCYVSYFFTVNNKFKSNYEKLFHSLLWRNYGESNLHKKDASIYQLNKGKNFIISGYPLLDEIIKYVSNTDPWPIKNKEVKRIIWAPHHTIEGKGAGLDYSTFNRYNEFFLDLCKSRQDLQFAFKPHPLLKKKLYEDENWGEKRTEEYYLKWKKMNNSLLVEGNYIELFTSSDALVHDCASFMVEYMVTKKPIIYLLRDKRVRNRFNQFGKLAFDKHYHAHNEKEIINIINKMVIDGIDKMQSGRLNFLNSHLVNLKGESATDRIFNNIEIALNK